MSLFKRKLTPAEMAIRKMEEETSGRLAVSRYGLRRTHSARIFNPKTGENYLITREGKPIYEGNSRRPEHG